MVKRVVKPGREKLQRAMRELSRSTVKVGYFADQGMHPEAKMNYPSLMYLQEVTGVHSRDGKVHRRVFELTTMESGKKIRNATMQSLRKNLVRGGDMKAVMDFFGEEMSKAIKENFGRVTQLTPANRPATIAHKGFNLPLIETSSLRDKLTYRIAKKGS